MVVRSKREPVVRSKREPVESEFGTKKLQDSPHRQPDGLSTSEPTRNREKPAIDHWTFNREANEDFTEFSPWAVKPPGINCINER